MKKIIIILGTFAIIHFVYYLFFVQKSTIYKKLSEKSKKYILDKKNDQDSLWSNVNLDAKKKKPEVLAANTDSKLINTDCFKLDIPLDIASNQETSQCNLLLTVKKPRTRIVIIHKKADVNKIDDLPEIQLRRMNPDKYEESFYDNNKYKFITFEKNEFTYEKTAFTLINSNLIAITLILPSNRNMNHTFQDILASFEYLL